MFGKHTTEVGQSALDSAIAAAARCMPSPFSQPNAAGQCGPGACNDGNYLKVTYVGGILGTLLAPTPLPATGAIAVVTVTMKTRFKGARLIVPHGICVPFPAAAGGDLFVTSVVVDNQEQLSSGSGSAIPAEAFDNLNGFDGAGRLDFKTAEINSTVSVSFAVAVGGTARLFISYAIQGVAA